MAKKRKPGRPLKLVKKTKDRLIQGIRLGMTFKDAATFSGITERTFHNWKNEAEKAAENDDTQNSYFQLFQQLAVAETEGMYRNLALINKHADKTYQAAAWLLERRFPEQFGRTIIDSKISGRIDIETDLGKAIDKLSELPLEELRKLAYEFSANGK